MKCFEAQVNPGGVSLKSIFAVLALNGTIR